MEIRTCQELLDFLASSDGEDLTATLQNDIDFAEYGQIMQEISMKYPVTVVGKVLDLNRYSVINLYPILCNLFSTDTAFSSYRLMIKNGYIKNVLMSHGHFINITKYNNSYMCTNYSNLFSDKRNVIGFKNVGFSLLGCNFYDKNFYNSSMVSGITENMFGLHTEIRFDNCSFYIKARNALPMVNSTFFANCSFYFDVEYDTLESVSEPDTTVFYFCVLKGKIKKSENFVRTTSNNCKNTLGETINCYIDIETDIPVLFVNVDLSKKLNEYWEIMRSPLITDISSISFSTDSVYNADKYSGTVDTDSGESNNVPVLGGQALTTEQMSDADYLLNCGFLAIDEESENV